MKFEYCGETYIGSRKRIVQELGSWLNEQNITYCDRVFNLGSQYYRYLAQSETIQAIKKHMIDMILDSIPHQALFTGTVKIGDRTIPVTDAPINELTEL